MNFSSIQTEVKRRATKDQSGTQFESAIKNAINSSIMRISRDALWKTLRRDGTFSTVTSYTEGSGAVSVTEDSAAVTVTGATFITDNIVIGRRIKFSGSSKSYGIATITGETTLTLDEVFTGTTTTTGSYSILPQEEYNLPIQTDHRMFMWHNQYGNSYLMNYWTEREFYQVGRDINFTGIPIGYRMWGEDWVIDQLLEPSTLTISSSSSSDLNIDVTIFGTVSGFPDYETITTNSADGTTDVVGSKSFSSVERVVKGSSSVGRITVTANSANTTVATMPVGETTDGIQYRKVKIHPLPTAAFIMNIRYYKQPYKLVNSNDIHELGEQFDEAIILLATSKLKYEQDQKEGASYFALYQDEVKSLRKTNTEKIDWFPKQKRRFDNVFPKVHPNLAYIQAGSFYGTSSRR